MDGFGVQRVPAAKVARDLGATDRRIVLPIGGDRFLVGDLEDRLLRFERDASGKVVRLIGISAEGEQSTNRDPG